MSRDIPTHNLSGVLPTAGAIPVRTKDGKLSMQKVKVQRYIAGKKPTFGDHSGSSASESDEERDVKPFDRDRDRRSRREEEVEDRRAAMKDKRLRRLQQYKDISRRGDEARMERHRRIHEPEVVSRGGVEPKAEAGSSDEEDEKPQIDHRRGRRHRSPSSDEQDTDDEGGGAGAQEEELSDDEIERRRAMLRRRMQQRNKQEEELLAKQQEDAEAKESDAEESSEYEEYTDSEDETAPRLKPVFVRKKDRVTLQETDKEEQRLRELQLEQKRSAEERKRQSVKMVEDAVRREKDREQELKEDNLDLQSVNTDDENEELAYECWKIRELKRIKRDKDEREKLAKEKAEWDRVHAMTEEERRNYLRMNPRVVTNKAEKGRYKFMQKYYHRGVFFLDEEERVLKQDFAQPTLEDRFDKSVLPKVMQVKDFGKAGRTKWTHLVSEDTTDFQAPWVSDTATNIKFHNKHAGGVKDIFERPAAKKKKTA